MNIPFVGLAVLFIIPLIGGYIAYVNNRDNQEFGVTLKRKRNE